MKALFKRESGLCPVYDTAYHTAINDEKKVKWKIL